MIATDHSAPAAGLPSLGMPSFGTPPCAAPLAAPVASLTTPPGTMADLLGTTMAIPADDMLRPVSPTIAAFLTAWADVLDDDEQDRVITPLLPLVAGTTTGPADEVRRAWLALDWTVRVFTPAWLSLVPELLGRSHNCRQLAPIDHAARILTVQPLIEAVAADARKVRRAAPWTADQRLSAAVYGETVETLLHATGGMAAGAIWAAEPHGLADGMLDEGGLGDVAYLAADAAAWVAVLRMDEAGQEAAIQTVMTTLLVSQQRLVRQMCAVGRPAAPPALVA